MSSRRRTIPARSTVALAVVVGLGWGCGRMVKEGDLEGLGLRNANSEPPPGLLRPVVEGDLEAVQRRGQLLHQMERSLTMAYEQGVMKVGDPGSDAVLPLVDVDPGGRSAQVLFVRWRPGLDGQMPALVAANAERWLLVSLLLSPDRVLDVELLAGALPDGSHLAHRVDTVVAAADKARTLASPGTSFHLFDLYEQVPVDPAKPVKGNKIIAQIYALSADGVGPDLELQVEPPRRRHPAELLGAAVVHQAGAPAASLAIETPTPGPVTVVRAMLRGPNTDRCAVESPHGPWTVVTATGELRRDEGGDPPGQGEAMPDQDDSAPDQLVTP